MAVEFKSHDVTYRGMSQYSNGQLIPHVRCRTEILPRGTPTERFGPYLAPNGKSYVVDVAVEVQPNRLVLYALQRGLQIDRTVSGFPIASMVFRQGLPVVLIHDGQEYPGILRQLTSPIRTY